MLARMNVVDNYTDYASLVGSEIADWPRQFWDPGRKLLLTIRRYQYWRRRRGIIAGLLCRGLVLRHRFWSVISGADIPLDCQIGGGLLIPHPNGNVIRPDAAIGVNCLIFQQVTLGIRSGPGVPIIGGHVDIAAGAKILGPVRIGDHTRIGANAVVTKDVPSHTTTVSTSYI